MEELLRHWKGRPQTRCETSKMYSLELQPQVWQQQAKQRMLLQPTPRILHCWTIAALPQRPSTLQPPASSGRLPPPQAMEQAVESWATAPDWTGAPGTAPHSTFEPPLGPRKCHWMHFLLLPPP